MKEHYIEFYVNNFNYLKSVNEADVSFVPPILRRRMSKFDKCAVSVLESAFSDRVQNIVFSSQNGEVERLLKIISQYTEDNEVSPNIFSGSVHNYPLGFYLLNKHKALSYTALAAGENSISAGLLSSVISKYDNNLFCYCDIQNGDYVSMAFIVSKTFDTRAEKFVLNLCENPCEAGFDDYLKLFTGKIDRIETNLYSIERAADVQ